ncbi:hypothetical protein AAG747_10565 [Rapidithrix thailandica]|uniref:Uncharacterized protein n=1 Tax=Rapidithrix thailandica TaxID=413964 RepID=A0AAW9RTY1_9BACT
MKRYFFSCWLIFGLLAQAQAQFANQPFENAEHFLINVENILFRSSSPTADSVWRDFEGVYPALNPEQQNKLYIISQNMYRKGLYANPHLENLYACVAYGKQSSMLGAEELNHFLDVAEKASEKYKKYVVANFLKTSRSLFEHGTLFQSKFNALAVHEAKVDFEMYDDATALEAVPEKPAPEVSESDLEPEKKEGEWFEHLKSEEEEGFDMTESGNKEDDWTDVGWGDDGDDGNWGDDWEEYKEEEEEPKVEKKVKPQPVKEAFDQVEYSYVPDPMPMPEISGPVMKLTNARMSMYSVFDSVDLEASEGTVVLKDFNFVGKGGKFYWENLGFGKEELYCEFNEYAFNLRSPRLKADFAKIYYKAKIDTVVEGHFVYESHRYNHQPEQALYPRFKSYNNNIVVKDLGPDLTYKGGFTLIGKKVYSTSYGKGPNQIEVALEGKKRFKAVSRAGFAFMDSLITNPKTDITIYQSESDSMYHAAVSVKYAQHDYFLQARRDKGQYKETAFYNTFHDVNVFAEFIEWDLTQDSMNIEILNAKDKIPLVIESADYFDLDRFKKLHGIYTFHPLLLAIHYANDKRSNIFRSDELAAYRKLNPKVVRGAMMELERQGFVFYNQDSDQFRLERKAWLYYYAHMKMNRMSNKADFDNMTIRSRAANATNATLNFKENQMLVRGVRNFVISDSMRVLVKPKDGEIILEEDRNTRFAGEMRAGKFIFRGKDFVFNYDSFKVVMTELDSVSFLVPDSVTGEDVELPNNIVGTAGTMYISRPNNKSGLKNYPGYPKLSATSGGEIQFGGSEVLGGAYDERVSFEIPPFEIDSINSSNPNSINFAGTFNSSGIFPDFEQRVGIQKDGSLGFTQHTPSEGYPLYEGKAQYYDKITLNNQGIRGKGRIEYLSGDFRSDDFIFYSDSLLTVGTEGVIESGVHEGVSFPGVKMTDYKMRWLIAQDSMLLTSQEGKPFEIYDPKSSFDGTLAFTPSELKGSGKLETPMSINESENYAFNETDYLSKNSTFRIKSEDPVTPAMLGKDVEVKYDLKERIAVIKAENDEDYQSFSFPFTQFLSTINTVVWNLDQGKLLMSVTGERENELFTFTSTHRDQDSLQFQAASSIYDLNDNSLNLSGVPKIRVANVNIIPDDGNLVIRGNAEIDPLQNAKIEMNATTKYHVLTDAEVKIRSRREFDAEAIYNYVNELSDTFPIKIDDFQVKYTKEKTKQGRVEQIVTTAKGTIQEEQPLKIMAGIKYVGEVKLLDNEPFPGLSGKVALDIDRENNAWFSYEKESAEESKMLYVDENLTEHGMRNKLQTGLYISRLDHDLYASFLEYDNLRAPDMPIFSGKGVLKYNTDKEVYTIAPEEKYEGSFNGSKLVYDHKKNNIEFEGQINFIKQKEKSTMNLRAAATGKISMDESSSFRANGLFLLDFEGGNAFMEEIRSILVDGLADAKPAIDNKPLFNLNLAQFAGNDFQPMATDERPPVTDFIKTSISIGDVRLKWSPEFSAFYSEGQLGLVSVGKTEVDAKVNGYVEIPKLEQDEVANFFFESPSGAWFFFSYQKNNVLALTSDPLLNEIIDKSKGDLNLADINEINIFVNTYRLNYLGKDDPVFIQVKESHSQRLYEEDQVGEFLDEEEGLPKEEKKKKKEKKEKEKDADDGDGF